MLMSDRYESEGLLGSITIFNKDIAYSRGGLNSEIDLNNKAHENYDGPIAWIEY